MLSRDDISGGVTFILRLWDAVGDPTQWVETLRGDTAVRWHDINRRSDWEALRAEAPGVFHNRATEEEVKFLLKSQSRCVYIHTLLVETDEVAGGTVAAGGVAVGGDTQLEVRSW